MLDLLHAEAHRIILWCGTSGQESAAIANIDRAIGKYSFGGSRPSDEILKVSRWLACKDPNEAKAFWADLFAKNRVNLNTLEEDVAARIAS